MPADVDVSVLETMGLEELRQAWREHFGPPPKLRSAEFLRRLLAWRLQAGDEGGDMAELQRLLKKGSARARPTLRPGLKLAREWKGVRHNVEIVHDGVLYKERTYESLSHVARTITGVRWNGPRFFGLRDSA